ncbi:hypothetical protein BDY19DRAFT_935397 [Irpex rosettiformis]|uniref:Uncharacterized protein n=1 Tax=Irpex rosettiformis TaxID=378272 RepID=A0ACB8UAU9_9APHY|nr:hypothetical protein BDY19DRAFT_935397 [Irpex rosettiformis]
MLFESVVRAVMRKMMGVAHGSDETPNPLLNGKFWTTDNPMDPNRALRPIWTSWPPNQSSWLREAVQKVQLNGHQYYAHPGGVNVKEVIERLTEVEIESALQTYWTSLRVKFLAKQKPVEEQSSKARDARLKGRRQNVSALNIVTKCQS